MHVTISGVVLMAGTPQAKCNAFEANRTHAADAVSRADLIIRSIRSVNRWRVYISPIISERAVQSCVEPRSHDIAPLKCPVARGAGK